MRKDMRKDLRKICLGMLLISLIVGGATASPLVPEDNPVEKYRRCFPRLDSLVKVKPAEVSSGYPETHLFMEIEAIGDYSDPGDSFVVKAVVTNIGDYTAICVFLRLENIPSGWLVHPDYHFICRLRPCTSVVKCFGVVRDDEDSTIHGSAWALNARKVLSNEIAIPIHPVVLLSLLLVFAVFYIHRRKKQ